MAYETARKLLQENYQWFFPSKLEYPENKETVYAIYIKNKENGLVYGDAYFYYLEGQWEFVGNSTILSDANILCWQYYSFDTIKKLNKEITEAKIEAEEKKCDIVIHICDFSYKKLLQEDASNIVPFFDHDPWKLTVQGYDIVKDKKDFIEYKKKEK